MEAVLAIGLAALLVKLVADEVSPQTGGVISRKRLCDYSVQGSVFEDVSSALRRGIRLVELHVYSDEQDYPVVAKHSLNGGYDYAYDNWTFEECCVAIANDAFPSADPLILSIVPHTNKNVTLNCIADHLKTTVHRHLIPNKDIANEPLDSFANKIIVVSGGSIAGTDLEELVNMSWNESSLRRLGYSQAVFPRDQPDLVAFNRNAITLVAPDPAFGKVDVNTQVVRAYGCQWVLFPDPSAATGFVEKPAGLQ